jgi:predicted RNase H-like nuclease (RuvC/YqgF family)
MIMTRGFRVVMLAGFVGLMGCEQKSGAPTPKKVTPDDVRRDAGQAVDTAVEYTRQTKEEFQKSLEARLNEMDAEIAKLREKGRDLKDQAKADWDRKMAELETKRDAARAKLTEVGQSSEEAWKDVQKGAQAAWDDLDKAFHDAAREF